MNLISPTIRYLFLVLQFCLAFASITCGQMKIVTQREIILSDDKEADFHIKMLSDGTALIIEKLEDSKNHSSPAYIFRKVNSALKTMWEKTIEIPFEFSENIDCLTPNYYYLLFDMPNSTKFSILKLDIITGNTESITGELIGIDTIFNLKVIDNTAFFNGKFHGRDVIVSFSFFNKKLTALTGFYSNYMEIINIETDLKLNILNVFVKNRFKRACELQMKTYDEKGLMLKSVIIENDEKKYPIRGKFFSVNDKETLVFGDYSRFCDPLSQGIYCNKQIENTIEKSQFHDFSDLKNFLNYANPKKTERLKQKISKRKKTGKSLNFSYPLIMHDLYSVDDEIIAVFEMYTSNPKGTLATSGFLGNQFSSFYNKEYTYKFTHFLFLGFDSTGKLVWDNNIPLKNLDSYDLEKKASLIFENGKIVLAYAKDGAIEYTVLDKGKKINELQKIELLKKNRNNFVNNEIYELLPFDQKNFLAWGYKIEASNPINGQKVLFLDKLEYVNQK